MYILIYIQIKTKGLIMLINSAIKKAKAQEAEKVAISLKVSADIKEQTSNNCRYK